MTPNLDLSWRNYLRFPEHVLTERSNEAIGFWQHLEDVRGDTWRVVPAAVQASVSGGKRDDRAAFESALATGRQTVLNTLPSSWVQDAARGRGAVGAVGPWDIYSSRLTTQWVKGAVRNDQAPVPVVAPVWTSKVKQVSLFADVVTVRPTGATQVYGRFGPGRAGDFTLADAAAQAFCAKPGGCACPQGTAPPVPLTAIDDGPSYVAVTGGTEAAGVEVRGISLSKFCQKRPGGSVTATNRPRGVVPTTCPRASVIAATAPGGAAAGWSYDGPVLPPNCSHRVQPAADTPRPGHSSRWRSTSAHASNPCSQKPDRSRFPAPTRPGGGGCSCTSSSADARSASPSPPPGRPSRPS